MSRLTFEEFAVGDSYDVGSRTVTKGQIVSFAEQYDPQPFHVDESEAAESHFGGLIASGWHTAAIMTELCVRNLFDEVAAAGGLGVDELSWPAPVRPGDTLSGTVEVVDTRASTSRSDRGYVGFEMRLTNDQGETVLTMINRQIIRRESGGD
jgi:acyl dehydratase